MTDPVKTCAICGHAQAVGEFCEACGARLPPGARPATSPPPPLSMDRTSSPVYVPPTRGSGFWSRFFDLSFQEFITPSLIKVLFVIAIIVIGIGVLASVIMGFVSSGVFGIFILIAALIAGFIYLLIARVALEMVVVFFRIRDNTEELAREKR